MFCKKGVLRNFTKFTGKHLCQCLRSATLLKKRLRHRCFPVGLSCEFCEISKNTFFYRTALLAAFEEQKKINGITSNEIIAC